MAARCAEVAYNWLVPISCHFRDYKALLVLGLTRVYRLSSAMASILGPSPLPFTLGYVKSVYLLCLLHNCRVLLSGESFLVLCGFSAFPNANIPGVYQSRNSLPFPESKLLPCYVMLYGLVGRSIIRQRHCMLFAKSKTVYLHVLSIYTVSQENCATYFFVRTLSNFDRLWKFLAQR